MIAGRVCPTGLIPLVMALVITGSFSLSSGDIPAADRVPVTHSVEINQFEFRPARVEIQPGDSVTWINLDLVPHSATALDHSWDTGLIATGGQKTIRFDTPTSTRYLCLFHPVMTAELIRQTDP